MARTPKTSLRLVSGVAGGGGTQRKVGTPKTSAKARFKGWAHGGGPRWCQRWYLLALEEFFK